MSAILCTPITPGQPPGIPSCASARIATHGERLRAFLVAQVSPRHAVALALALGALLGIGFGLDALPAVARATLIVFALAIVAWSVLRLPETPVAIAGGLGLIACGATTSEKFYAGMGDDLIWLLIGAFVLAAVLRQSGLAERFALRAVAGAGTVRQLCYRLTWLIAATAFVIPSTSGRAALLLPVFVALARAIPDSRVVRALGLLFPTVILLSACASLLGAGAHLVAVDFMAQMDMPPLGFFDWALLGLPFALATSFAATALILRTFLGRETRELALSLPAPQATPWTRQQAGIVAATVLTIGLWATSSLHGIDAAAIALGGALLATSKAVTGVSMKDALKGVEWNLILFLAATLVMGEALIHSGAARWLAQAAVAGLPAQAMAHPWLAIAAASLIAMLAHLVITSRSARAMVLIPTVALPLSAAQLDPAALIFLTVVASGFCQTLTVSAKPVALYAKLETPTYCERDLTRLSFYLMPIMAALLLAFALVVWPFLGLPIVTTR